jgi:hypothetical protein
MYQLTNTFKINKQKWKILPGYAYKIYMKQKNFVFRLESDPWDVR